MYLTDEERQKRKSDYMREYWRRKKCDPKYMQANASRCRETRVVQKQMKELAEQRKQNPNAYIPVAPPLVIQKILEPQVSAVVQGARNDVAYLLNLYGLRYSHERTVLA